jgi:hypothetical protein
VWTDGQIDVAKQKGMFMQLLVASVPEKLKIHYLPSPSAESGERLKYTLTSSC